MRKRAIFLVLALIMAAATVVRAQTTEPSVSKEAVRQAIATFRQDPTSPQAGMARSLIVRFVQESPDVAITMTPKVLPWMNDSEVPTEVGATLLAAFVTGETSSQLDKGKAKDDAVAGVEQVIATYRQIQKTQPALKIAAVEKFIDLQKQGKLADYLKAP